MSYTVQIKWPGDSSFTDVTAEADRDYGYDLYAGGKDFRFIKNTFTISLVYSSAVALKLLAILPTDLVPVTIDKDGSRLFTGYLLPTDGQTYASWKRTTLPITVQDPSLALDTGLTADLVYVDHWLSKPSDTTKSILHKLFALASVSTSLSAPNTASTSTMGGTFDPVTNNYLPLFVAKVGDNLLDVLTNLLWQQGWRWWFDAAGVAQFAPWVATTGYSVTFSVANENVIDGSFAVEKTTLAEDSVQVAYTRAEAITDVQNAGGGASTEERWACYKASDPAQVIPLQVDGTQAYNLTPAAGSTTHITIQAPLSFEGRDFVAWLISSLKFYVTNFGAYDFWADVPSRNEYGQTIYVNTHFVGTGESARRWISIDTSTLVASEERIDATGATGGLSISSLTFVAGVMNFDLTTVGTLGIGIMIPKLTATYNGGTRTKKSWGTRRSGPRKYNLTIPTTDAMAKNTAKNIREVIVALPQTYSVRSYQDYAIGAGATVDIGGISASGILFGKAYDQARRVFTYKVKQLASVVPGTTTIVAPPVSVGAQLYQSGVNPEEFLVLLSTTQLIRGLDRVLTPDLIYASGQRRVGINGAPVLGRFKVSEDPGTGAFSLKYTSGSDEASVAYTPTATAIVVQFDFYAPGGTVTLLASNRALVSDQAAPSFPSASQIYAHWSFDDSPSVAVNGDPITDVSGNGRNSTSGRVVTGTDGGSPWTNGLGRSGMGLRTGGGSSTTNRAYANLGSRTDYPDTTGQFWVSGWFQLPSDYDAANTIQGILGHNNETASGLTGSDTTGQGWQVLINGTDLRPRVRWGKPGTTFISLAPPAVAVGLHHFLFAYASTGPEFWIDGVLTNTPNPAEFFGDIIGTISGLSALTKNMRAGNWVRGSGANHYRGLIDEVIIGPGVLTDQQKIGLYTITSGPQLAATLAASQAYADALNTAMQAQVDRAIVFYDAVADPSGAWTTTALKNAHIGDYWRLTATTPWSTWAGTAWSQLPDGAAQDTANAAATLAGKKTTLWASRTVANTTGNAVIGDMFLDAGLLYRTTVAPTGITLANSTRLTPKRYDDVANSTARGALTGMIVGDRVYQLSTLRWFYYDGSAWVVDGPTLTSVVVDYTPRYLGKYLDSAPTANGAGDTYVRYSTTSGSTNRGVFYWDGSAWVRTEDPKYVNAALADISFIISYRNTSGTAIYGSATSYTGDATMQASFAFFQSAIIGYLEAANIKVRGSLVIGDRYDNTGAVIDDTKDGIYLPNTGKGKMAGLEFEGARGGGVQWGGPIQVGTGLSIASVGIPVLAALNGTDVAFIDNTGDSLRTYRFNGATWALVGSGLSISSNDVAALTALNGTDVAYVDFNNDSLRTYRFNGSTWSLVGSGLSISTVGYPALAALNGTDVAFIDDSNMALRTYRFNGSTWSLVGSGLSISTISKPALAALNGTDVAFIDETKESLRTYRFNGSTWSLVGSGLSIPGINYPKLTALNGTDVAFIDGANDELKVFRFNGSSWSQVSSAGNTGISSVSVGFAALNGTDIAFVDGSSDTLRTYRFGFALSIPYSRVLTG